MTDEKLAQAIGQLVLRTMQKSPFKREAAINVRVEQTVERDGTTGVDVKVWARRWTPDESTEPVWPLGVMGRDG